MKPADEEEFASVLTGAAAELLAYFERRVQPREDAADLLSEVMLQAWRRADAMPTDPEHRRMWLFTIARNVMSNRARTMRRRSALIDRIRGQLTAELVPDSSDAFAMRDLVRRLPEPQRELVMLIHWDGFNIREAAELLAINPSTARSRYATAREELQQALKPEHSPRD